MICPRRATFSVSTARAHTHVFLGGTNLAWIFFGSGTVVAAVKMDTGDTRYVLLFFFLVLSVLRAPDGLKRWRD